ncbi:putative pathogenicity factor [Aspergillus alliaceus]|uniref:putative pathogenicity factor n=1 Tax=Petromyces alliaceus TaxID=209559 RepID=UPI0012A636B0|nr:uncharacterized protein BDW43DRAFT_92926 [Aspergillus alliaceus]KAB8233059.1 hypothetical protein BDW43DRAFT_92926 [Aspergillus alliaceus]
MPTPNLQNQDLPRDLNQEQDPTFPPCEFTHPCPSSTEPNNPRRKVISHIFGRNKTATKRFPSHLWVHYCRQHYQRARYRIDWPFTQCELLTVVLGRMEKWGGVKGWEVVLRKRELERLTSYNTCEDGAIVVDDQRRSEGGGGYGRRKDSVCENEGRTLSSASSSSLSLYSDDPDPDLVFARKEARSKKRKKPTILVGPVPGWLLGEVGRGKSFADLKGLVSRVRGEMDSLRAAGVAAERIVFPDIELLPTFQPWVLASVKKRRRTRGGGERKNSRTDGKGGVRRVEGGGGVVI